VSAGSQSHKPERARDGQRYQTSAGAVAHARAASVGLLSQPLAGKAEGATEVPVIVARGWTEEQCRAYAIADNKLALNSDWDDEALAAATHRRPDPHDACGRKTGPRDLRVGSTAAFRLER
jgi:hypothetical protein